jgi:hypothetical protein
MGEYRTPGSMRWALWVTAALLLAALAAVLRWVPPEPFAGLLACLIALLGPGTFAMLRAWAAWRRTPTYLRLSQSQMSARRGDGSVIAEIPYPAIAAIEDRFWSDTIVVRGMDGFSRIEIPLATAGIRELLIALADLIPPYLWDVESTRRFTRPVNWTLLPAAGLLCLAVAACAFWAGWFWPALAAGTAGVAVLGSMALRERHYEVSRAGCTIRRILGQRFVPAKEVASVQLKRGSAGPVLYVSLLLHSGKRVALRDAEQSAVVLYRALLDMRKSGA